MFGGVSNVAFSNSNAGFLRLTLRFLSDTLCDSVSDNYHFKWQNYIFVYTYTCITYILWNIKYKTYPIFLQTPLVASVLPCSIFLSISILSSSDKATPLLFTPFFPSMHMCSTIPSFISLYGLHQSSSF